jgi:chorismate lyase / 3-hydroxybenzoate synthase
VPSTKASSRLTLVQALTRRGESPVGSAGGVVAPRDLLGAICYGEEALLDSQRSVPAHRELAIQYVATPLLGTAGRDGQSCLWQLICTDKPVRRGQAGRIRFCSDGDFVFGVLELPRVRGGCGVPVDLRRGAQGVYEEIFSFLDASDPDRPFKLWRAWNYVSDIHAEENELERYRQFNIGRLRAFTEHWSTRAGKAPSSDDSTREIPASCGVGMIGPSLGAAPGIDLSVAFLASRATFNQVENPRQISAFHYPVEYGPSSPTFSRAILGMADSASGRPRPYLFISGTGSIIGHRTVHDGDVAKQARETLRNIEALLQEANSRHSAGGQMRLTMPELQYLVYLRQPRDLPTVESVLAEVLGAQARVRVVHAEICRSDLLIEIEASLLCAPTST